MSELTEALKLLGFQVLLAVLFFAVVALFLS